MPEQMFGSRPQRWETEARVRRERHGFPTGS